MPESTPAVLQGTLEMMLLAVLSPAPLHGYAVARAIEQACGGTLSIEEGSLYPALKRLEKRGDLEGRWVTTPTGRRGRAFSLTRQGRDRLDDQAELWRKVRDAVDRVLEGALGAG